MKDSDFDKLIQEVNAGAIQVDDILDIIEKDPISEKQRQELWMNKKFVGKMNHIASLMNSENFKDTVELLYPDTAKEKYKTLTIRVPRTLHEVLKEWSYFSEKSINQIMLESLIEGLKNWDPKQFITRNPDKFYDYIETPMYENTKYKLNIAWNSIIATANTK